MDLDSIRKNAFAMPVHNPAFPRPPFRFVNREYFIISYESDPDAIAAAVPAPLKPENALVHYEFIRMPDSSGFGDYTESGQVISVRDADGRLGNYTHSMYLDDEGPITARNASRQARWVTSTGRSTWKPSARSSPTRRTIC
jgi:acetoacetate decarboxylase